MAIILVLFLGPMLATIPVTAGICQYRAARNRPISYGTMFTAASCIPLLLAIIATCIDPSMWLTREGKNVPELWFVMLLFIAAMCVLPALGVAAYYERRGNK